MVFRASVLALLLLGSTLAGAQGYPSKSVRFVVPFAPGGGSDIVAKAPASAGLGSGTHLAAELLKMLVAIDILHVPYKGTGPALNDLIGGQVQVMVSTFASALPHVKSGRLRALGVTTARRSPAAPDIPTLAEPGVPGFDYSTWYALFVPAGTPPSVIEKLNQTTRSVLARDDVKHRLDTQGVDAATTTPAELGAYLRSETGEVGESRAGDGRDRGMSLTVVTLTQARRDDGPSHCYCFPRPRRFATSV